MNTDWPYRQPPTEALRGDAEFAALVAALEAAIHRHQFTPAELREAVILAATRYESRLCPPIRVTDAQIEWLRDHGKQGRDD